MERSLRLGTKSLWKKALLVSIILLVVLFAAGRSAAPVSSARRSHRGKRFYLSSHPTLYRVLAYTITDWWNNVKAVAFVHVPILVVHSDADRVNPVEGGLQIFAAASQPKTLALLHGFTHNALYQEPTEAWWSPVLAFVNAPSRIPAVAVPQRRAGRPFLAALNWSKRLFFVSPSRNPN